MVRFVYISILAWLAAGCSSIKASQQPSSLPVIYRNAQYGLTFRLPAGWQGYSVLVQEWEGIRYDAKLDQDVMVGKGPIIILRHPAWKVGNPCQDIPIAVLTRDQWKAYHKGEFPLDAGGVEYEISHNSRYVFAISSRFNSDDSMPGSEEADVVVGQNGTSSPVFEEP